MKGHLPDITAEVQYPPYVANEAVDIASIGCWFAGATGRLEFGPTIAITAVSDAQ
jgi:hypothetical protein